MMVDDILQLAHNQQFLERITNGMQAGGNLELLKKLPKYSDLHDLERKLKSEGQLDFQTIFHYIPDTRHVLTIAVSEEEGLYYENSIAKQDPNAVVLALAAEIQSPLGRMYNDNISLEKSIYMPNVLFGDAAGCAVIGRPSTRGNDAAYAVHPGGKKLLQNFESLISDHGVENAGNELKNSYKNLREYGNLASAAIIFILGDVCRETKKDAIYFMAMGPGVCLEYGGMKRYRQGAKRTVSRAHQKDGGSNLVPLLMAVIVLLVAFIVGGYTVNDLNNML